MSGEKLPGFDALDALMAEEGVQRLERPRKAPSPQRVADKRPPPPPPRAAPPAGPEPGVHRHRALELRARDFELRIQELEQQARALQQVHQAQSRELARAIDERLALEGRHRALQGDYEALGVLFQAQAIELEEARQPIPAPPPPPPAVPLGRLLAERGLLPGESAAALRLLVDGGGSETLASLELSDPEPLRTLLQERLVLCCGEAACTRLLDGAAWLGVSSGRCEVCGGSTVQGAFASLVRACKDAGVRRLAIVGGSPVYRRVLRDLARPLRKELRLELVDGRSKPGARRVQGLARNADLVVVWASTILDHATTDAFRAGGATTLTVPIRGIASMLVHVAGELRRARTAP